MLVLTGLNNNTVAFEFDGDAPPNYKILNFQKSTSGTYGYQEVGQYNLNQLILNSSKIQFPLPLLAKQGKNMGSEVPESLCSYPCPNGQFRYVQTLVSTKDVMVRNNKH